MIFLAKYPLIEDIDVEVRFFFFFFFLLPECREHITHINPYTKQISSCYVRV